VPAKSITVLVGNPRVGSRTLTVATTVAERLAAELGGSLERVVDLGELGPQVLDPDSAAATAEAEAVAARDLLVVASPIYKATYTGLLKSFLDRYRGPGLTGVVAVGVLVGGAADHAQAGEVHLRPLLVELGAVIPARTLFVLDSQLDQLDEKLAAWLETAAPPLRAALGAG
jgi:FMN reductase